jgi:hypothetical protein
VDAQIYVTKRDAVNIFDTDDISTIFVRVSDIEEAEAKPTMLLILLTKKKLNLIMRLLELSALKLQFHSCWTNLSIPV